MIANSKFYLLFIIYMRIFLKRPTIDILLIMLLGTVSVLICSGLMLNRTILETFSSSGDADTLIILSRGANSEAESFLLDSDVNEFMSFLSVNDYAEKFKLDKQVVITTSIKIKNRLRFVALRGISSDSKSILEKIKITDGEIFASGLNEVIVGRSIAGKISGARVGGTITLANREWIVSGIFSMKGDIRENEIIGDKTQLQFNYGAEKLTNTIRLAGNHQLLDVVQNELNAKNDLGLAAEYETQFFENQSKKTVTIIHRIQILITVLVVSSVLLGMIAVQKIQLANLINELRTLILIGFQATDIFFSLILRSVFNGFVSALLSCLILFCVIDSRVVEFDFGMQLAYISLKTGPIIYVLIFAITFGLAMISSLFLKIDERMARWL